MKVNPIRISRLALCLSFLTASILSCVSKNPSPNNDTQKVLVSDSLTSNAGEMDTTLRLKFTSGIRSILEDSKGNIWFGSHQEGVGLFDGKKLSYFSVVDGLCSPQIRSIYEDANGMVWFEGGEGISSYDGKRILTHPLKDYSSKNNWQSGKDDLWFKGDEGIGYNDLEVQPGVYRYDGNLLSYHVFPLTDKPGYENYYSVSTPFARGKNGKVWFGTYGAVIGYSAASLITGQSAFTIIDDEYLGLNEETGFLHVRCIMEDSKGNLWIGNNGIGVLLYDGNKAINFSEKQGLISENSLRTGGYRSPAWSLEHVFAIGEDQEGNIWFGDRDTGAWRYDGTSMKNFTSDDGLTTTHIWQIYNSRKGELWFAMGDGAVLRFNGASFDRIF